jgi:hypothetical protein
MGLQQIALARLILRDRPCETAESLGPQLDAVQVLVQALKGFHQIADYQVFRLFRHCFTPLAGSAIVASRT